MRTFNFGAFLFASAAIITGVLLAGTQSVLAHEPYYRQAESTECAAPRVEKHIMRRFAHQADHVHHRTDWRIDALSDIHQHRYLPQDVHQARPIARRYCHANVHFNDGTQRKIWYLIEGGMGFAGFGGNEIEFCVDGLDPQNVYNSYCRTLR